MSKERDLTKVGTYERPRMRHLKPSLLLVEKFFPSLAAAESQSAARQNSLQEDTDQERTRFTPNIRAAELNSPTEQSAPNNEKQREETGPSRAHPETDTPLLQNLSDNDPVWKMYLEQGRAYDDELAKVLNSDLDSLLIFAGLFSTILSAFLIEIRKGLQEDLQSTTNSLLLAIIQRMDNLSSNSSFVPPPPFEPAPSSVWINALWFLSLTFSMASALGAILAKGWIAQYTAISSSAGIPAHDACMHFVQLDGVTRWHLRTVINCLPIPLHIAFFLFFTGLVVLLGHDDSTIQSLVLALVVATTTLYIATSVIPIQYPNCPFRTPLSTIIARLFIRNNRSSRPGPASPLSGELMAKVLGWLLVNSTRKEVVDKALEAIAGLPATAQVQVALSQDNVARFLARGLTELMRSAHMYDRPPYQDLNARIQLYLYAILRLVQTGPSGRAIEPLIGLVPGSPAWQAFLTGTPQIAFSVWVRIELLHSQIDPIPDLYYMRKLLYELDVVMLHEPLPQVQHLLMEGATLIHDLKMSGGSNVQGSLLHMLKSKNLRTRNEGLERLSRYAAELVKNPTTIPARSYMDEIGILFQKQENPTSSSQE